MPPSLTRMQLTQTLLNLLFIKKLQRSLQINFLFRLDFFQAIALCLSVVYFAVYAITCSSVKFHSVLASLLKSRSPKSNKNSSSAERILKHPQRKRYSWSKDIEYSAQNIFILTSNVIRKIASFQGIDNLEANNLYTI